MMIALSFLAGDGLRFYQDCCIMSLYISFVLLVFFFSHFTHTKVKMQNRVNEQSLQTNGHNDKVYKWVSGPQRWNMVQLLLNNKKWTRNWQTVKFERIHWTRIPTTWRDDL